MSLMPFPNPHRTRNIFQQIIDAIGGNVPQPPNMPGNIPQMGSPTFPNAGVISNPETGNIPSDTMWMDTINKLRQRMGEMPQREDFQPSILRRIGAGIKGIGSGRPMGMYGGVPVGWMSNNQAADEFRDRPFNEAMTDWSNEVQQLGGLGRLESQILQEERLREDNKADREYRNRSLDIQEGRLGESERAARERERIQGERLELDKQKAALAEFKARNPNWQFRATAGGNVIAFNPQDPSRTIDTGVPTGTLSDLEKINLGLQNTLTAIDARQADSLERLEVGQDNALERIEAQGAQQRQTNAARPVTSAASSPSVQRTAMINKAIDIINRNPEYREFFELDMQGRPTGVMSEPPTAWGNWGADKVKAYNEAKTAFLGVEPQMTRSGSNTPPPNNVVPSNTPTQSNPNIPREPPTGSVFMMSSDGKSLAVVPEERIQEFIDQGYSRVRRRQ